VKRKKGCRWYAKYVEAPMYGRYIQVFLLVQRIRISPLLAVVVPVEEHVDHANKLL